MQMLVPVTVRTKTIGSLAPRNDPGGPVVLGLIDNGRVRSADMLAAVSEVLMKRGIVNDSITLLKADAVATEEERAELTKRADLVITGVGSCGSCTTRTVHDAMQCDMEGTPATAIVTEMFLPIARGVMDALGHPDYPIIVVPHPVWTRSPEWFAQTAELIADQVLDNLGVTSRP
jgi:hypothetical protein